MHSIMRLMMLVSRSQSKFICADSDLTLQASTTVAGISTVVVTLVVIFRSGQNPMCVRIHMYSSQFLSELRFSILVYIV